MCLTVVSHPIVDEERTYLDTVSLPVLNFFITGYLIESDGDTAVSSQSS